LKVLEHLREHHTEPEAPRASLVNKVEEDWPDTLLAKVRSFLCSSRVAEQLTQLFGTESYGGADASADRHRGRGPSAPRRSERSHTHALARLSRDVAECWPYLSGAVRQRVRRHFQVDDGRRPIRVEVRKNTGT